MVAKKEDATTCCFKAVVFFLYLLKFESRTLFKHTSSPRFILFILTPLWLGCILRSLSARQRSQTTQASVGCSCSPCHLSVWGTWSLVLCIFNCYFKFFKKIHCDSALTQKIAVCAEGIKAEQQGRNLIFLEQVFIIVRIVSIPHSRATTKF